MTPINKNNPLPLYYQVVEDIRAQISNKQINPGDKLPTEKWLVEHYDVSRVTIRKALEELANEEAIERVRGKGPIVAYPKIHRNAARLTGLHEEIAKAGMKSSSVISNVKQIGADAKIARIMNVEEGEPLLYFRRLRLGDNVPIADQIIYLRERYCKGLNPHILHDKSLYKIYENNYGLKIDYADQTLSVSAPTKKQTQDLELSDKTSLLCMKRTTWLTSGESIEYTEVCYVVSRYELSMRLYR